jgi:hypothetical protein
VRHLHRWKLGTSYTQIVSDVVELMKRPPLPGACLVPDQTGVGRPVVDMLRHAKPPAWIEPVTITSGTAVSRNEDGSVHVPKKELVSTLQVLFQSGRLRVVNCGRWSDRLTRALCPACYADGPTRSLYGTDGRRLPEAQPAAPARGDEALDAGPAGHLRARAESETAADGAGRVRRRKRVRTLKGEEAGPAHAKAPGHPGHPGA